VKRIPGLQSWRQPKRIGAVREVRRRRAKPVAVGIGRARNGAPNIERADKLVLARQKSLSHPVIDANVTLVDELLEKNLRNAML
jgi:hypothetical protein